MWQLINSETGKTQEDDYKLELKIANNIISNLTEITEKINMYFKNTVAAELVQQNINKGTCYTIQLMHYSHFKTQSLQHLKPINC